jgi:KipI family sensor histidine kinase inhibitor
MQIRAAGESALLVDVGEGLVEAWRAELWRRRDEGDLIADEIVPGARTILLDGVPDVASLAARLPGWAPPPGSPPAGSPLISIPIWYGGEDLDAVAAVWRLTPNAAIARHLGTEFRAAFCGFAPGFAYLTGLADPVPRLATPRTRVPAGSVGLADVYCGIYPTASPGGWRLIGRTDARLFDAERDPPALLTPGTRVRFVRADS